MLTAAEAKYGVDLSSSFMVGDRYSDMLAGWKAGCICYFIDHGYFESPQLISAPRFSSLAEVAESILPLSA
jgi:D-glycero-D-manno-heptose 1,7-bisphosphate phosphatase